MVKLISSKQKQVNKQTNKNGAKRKEIPSHSEKECSLFLAFKNQQGWGGEESCSVPALTPHPSTQSVQSPQGTGKC